MTKAYVAKCTACTHEQVELIDADINAKRLTQAEVGEKYGLHGKVIWRHVRNGHVTPPPAPKNGSGRGSSRGEVDATALGRMRKIVDDLAAVDVSEISPSARVQHLNAYRMAVESLAKLEPEDPEARRVTIGDVERLPELLDVLVAVLEPHPTIRRELAARLEKAGLSEVLG